MCLWHTLAQCQWQCQPHPLLLRLYHGHTVQLSLCLPLRHWDSDHHWVPHWLPLLELIRVHHSVSLLILLCQRLTHAHALRHYQYNANGQRQSLSVW